ncbi:MAG: response regulator [Bacteroidetes bacterium]|nr:response regulator [Bacteroidota bacterium]
MNTGNILNFHVPSVVIVDDVPDNLKILGDILEVEGYKVRPVLNGLLALQVAEKERPDLILLDIMMPHMDGYEVCRRLKESRNLSKVPVIFISALNDTEDVVKALGAGGVDYISKPFKAEEVKARVSAHIKLFRQSIELQELNEKLEERVESRTRQLDTTNRELGFHLKEIEQFTFITSHDLQEPLLTLTNFTQLLQEEYAGKLDENGNKYIEFICNSANRMKTLVKGLMDYSLLGKAALKTRVDCNKLVVGVLSEMSGSIEKANAAVVVQPLPVLPCYQFELRLLFHNLISNALKFRRPEIDPEITISASNQGEEWVFSVADNGIGIEEKDQEKVFIIFKTLHNRNDYDGTGIGLAHCKKIVEMHGGKIWVSLNKAGGSTFYFTIPVGAKAF